MSKTLPKFPVAFGTLLCKLDPPAFIIAIIDTLAAIPGMKKIGPSDDARYDKEL
jgi:hypothetical protein